MLTDTKLRALRPKGTAFRMADSGGLCVEVRPSGKKVWRYRYRIAGKPSIATIGEYPFVTLQQARTERDRLRNLVKGGASPYLVAQAEKAAQIDRNASTFRAIGLELLSKRTKEGLSAGSVRREKRIIEIDLASIGAVPITQLSAPMLLTALRKLEARRVVETAHRARALAGRIFKYAIATGRAERNPAHDLLGALEQPQTRHISSVTDPHKVAEILRALHIYSGTPPTVAALKLAPLVFVRPGELRSAKWDDIDFTAAEWKYTTSKTKVPHIVPLASQAIDILRDLHPYTSRSEYVFPSERSAARPMSENTVNAALRNLGIGGDLITGHGFRAMARTLLDETLGFRPDFIEHQLAHRVRDPLGRAYNRTTHLAERKKMMQAWADYLDELRNGDGKVSALRLRKRA